MLYTMIATTNYKFSIADAGSKKSLVINSLYNIPKDFFLSDGYRKKPVLFGLGGYTEGCWVIVTDPEQVKEKFISLGWEYVENESDVYKN